MSLFNIGDTVRAHYNSGVYIGTIKEDRGDRFLVQVQAILKHPMQGDLHNPGSVDQDVFFHTRKALAHNEKMNVTKAVIYPYDDSIPSYRDSLLDALANMREELTQNENAFTKQALKNLDDLENNDYQKKYYH